MKAKIAKAGCMPRNNIGAGGPSREAGKMPGKAANYKAHTQGAQRTRLKLAWRIRLEVDKRVNDINSI